MPLYQKKEINTDLKLGIWEISEKLFWLEENTVLCDADIQKYNSFKNESRKKQWLAIRLLLSKLSTDTNYIIQNNENQAPCLNKLNKYISISHTQNYAAITLGSSAETGIDIEKISSRILKVKDKFISKEEFTFINPSKDFTEQLTLIWSAKEALYKSFRTGNLDFKTNLLIKPFILKQKDELTGWIIKDKIRKKYKLEYEFFNDHIWVCAIAII